MRTAWQRTLARLSTATRGNNLESACCGTSVGEGGKGMA